MRDFGPRNELRIVVRCDDQMND